MEMDYSTKENQKKSISVKNIIEDLKLETLYMPDDRDYYIESVDINRPSLQLAGFFEVFSYDRLQILGLTEWRYMQTLEKERLELVIDKMFSFDIPLVIVTTGLETDEIIIKKAKEHKIPLAKSEERSTHLISVISTYLSENLAKEIMIHGVLVDVDGVGILITGESGIGKSETALELVRLNHRLVADDAVSIKKPGENALLGQAPQMLKNLIEVRGIGILNVKTLYGIGAVKPKKTIDLHVKLEVWDETKYYNRLGLDDEYIEILETKIPSITIPVRPGRNMAIIIEVAARNFREKNQHIDKEDVMEQLINDLKK